MLFVAAYLCGVSSKLQKLESMTTKDIVFSHIKGQLAAGQLESAIREIRLLSPNRSITRELKKYQLLLSRLRKLLRQGIMRKWEFHQARNKIHLALLEVLWEVERAPSSLGLLTAILRIPAGWKAAILSPVAIALALYLWLAFPYPFELPDMDEPEAIEQEQSAEEQGKENALEIGQMLLKRVGP